MDTARQRTIAAGVALLVLMVATIYLPALRAGTIWDDPEYVTQNTTLRSAEGLKRIWLEPGATPQYYPLVFTTFWLEYRLWELRPFGFHLTNVLLHLANALLLWLLLRRLAVPGAWLAAAIFAVHPVHVESVAWITERKNVLSGFFYLSSLFMYLRYLGLGEEGGPSRRGLVYALSLGLFLCALLSKTVTCTLPVAILLLLWWKKERLSWRDGLPLILFFVAGAAFGSMTVWMEKFFVGAQGEEWLHSPLDRILVASRIPWFYAGKLLWPGTLSFIYPRWRIDDGSGWAYLFPLATVGLVIGLWCLRKRAGKGSLTAVLFFLVTLFPALGFFDVYPMRFSFVADHFQYLASLGPIVPFAALASHRIETFGARPPGRAGPVWIILCCLILGLLGLKTRQQGYIYKDQETLWRDTLSKNRGAWIAHNNLAEILVAQGKLDEAAHHCAEALDLKDDLPEAHGNLANLLFRKGRFDEAVPHYEAVLRADPKNVIAHNNLAATLEALGRKKEALAHFQEALRINPGFANAHYNFANFLSREGQAKEALRHYDEAVSINPDFPQARYRFGLALQARRDRTGAVRQYREALRIRPNWLEVENNLAWLLATTKAFPPGAAAEAVRLAEAACRRAGDRVPTLLDTLAAAYGGAGRFEEAVDSAQRAIELAKDGGDEAFVEAVRGRLQHYMEGKPFYEE